VGGERKKGMKMKKMKRMMESVGKRQELGRRQQLRAFSSPFRRGLPVIERVQERRKARCISARWRYAKIIF
jgi:hypothetical protein